MKKHTPGPWNLYLNSYDDCVIRKMFPDNTEAHVVAHCKSGIQNARLIAAAPELLEALKLAQSIIGHPDDAHSRHIAAVIAKAEAA
jgi:hypothetical protein